MRRIISARMRWTPFPKLSRISSGAWALGVLLFLGALSGSARAGRLQHELNPGPFTGGGWLAGEDGYLHVSPGRILRPVDIYAAYDSDACPLASGLPVLMPSAVTASNPLLRLNRIAISQVRAWYSHFRENDDPVFQEDSVCVGFIAENSGGDPRPETFTDGDQRYILFDIRVYEELLSSPVVEDPEYGRYRAVVALSHDFGHILQDEYQAGFRTSEYREAELQSDCMAGYLTGISTGFAGTGGFAYSPALGPVSDDFFVHAPHFSGSTAERTEAFRLGTGIASVSLAQDQSSPLDSVELVAGCNLYYPSSSGSRRLRNVQRRVRDILDRVMEGVQLR